MKKMILLAVAFVLLLLCCYLFYMQDCFIPFEFMARFKEDFSLLKLTADTRYYFSPNWFILLIAIFPALAGYLFCWLKPTFVRYILPSCWLFFWSNVFLNYPIAGQWHILGTLRYYPEYYAYLPAWLKFIIDYFPAVGIGH